MSYFDINNLIDDSLLISEKSHSVYEKILFKIYKKIKLINKKRKYNFVYEVPNYVFGHALYDIKACIVFIIVALRKKNIQVKYINPNLLVISWENIILNSYKNLKTTKIYQAPKNKMNIINPIHNKQPTNIQNIEQVKQNKFDIKKHNKNMIKSFSNNDNIIDTNLSQLINQSKYM